VPLAQLDRVLDF